MILYLLSIYMLSQRVHSSVESIFQEVCLHSLPFPISYEISLNKLMVILNLQDIENILQIEYYNQLVERDFIGNREWQGMEAFLN